MLKSVVPIGALAGVVCLSLACRTASTDPPQAEIHQSPSPAVATAPAPAPGTIRGVVHFHGRAPVMPPIDFSSNPQCERQHPKIVREQSVVVNPNHTLRDTFVWIKSGLAPARWTPPAASAELDQEGCLYTPHVLAFMVNQDLEIRNSDPVNHDVHVEAVRNASSNESEPPRAETLHKRYPAQEIWFSVTCGVHPWMRSYLAVVAHPYFAVTAADGAFAWNNVPPGRYVVESIQEKFGHREQAVTVASGATAVLNFVYAP